MSEIEASGLTRYYGALCAVDHLDLSVSSGELMGFLGPNGAGKTTTIRLLTGLIRPTEGHASVAGIDVAHDPLGVKAQVGVVPQRSNLYAEMSARDNLVFMAQLYGLPRGERRARADELLERFALAERAESRFGALSGGLKRRLTIAAALVHAPPILFMDEPTVGLDVHSARSLRALIAELRAEGVTIFLTTHLIHEAEALADRVAIIVRGELVAVDTPTALKARYQTENALELRLTTPTPAFAQSLVRSAAIAGVSATGDRLRLTVRSLGEALRDVADATRDLDVGIEEIRSVEPSLEDAFVQLTHLDLEAMRSGPSSGSGGGGR
jgi:ABC-2 type transport system ATP-binding protein